VADVDCPHGLEPEWCSLCKQAASGAPPTGVKRRPAPRGPSTRGPAATRTPRAPRSVSPSAPPLGPVDALAKVRRVLFHATAYGAWESIAESGLRTAAQALESDAATRVREDDIVVPAPAGGSFTVREQRLMARSRIEDHLAGVTLPEWLALLNRRAFLFAQQKDLTTHLARFQHSVGQDVIVFETGRLLRTARGRVEVTTDPSTLPEGFGHCPCRGPHTFVPLESYRGSPADVVEVTVIDGIESIEGLVTRVVRYHPKGSPEVLVG